MRALNSGKDGVKQPLFYSEVKSGLAYLLKQKTESLPIAMFFSPVIPLLGSSSLENILNTKNKLPYAKDNYHRIIYNQKSKTP